MENYVTTLTYTSCFRCLRLCIVLKLMLINKVPSCTCLFEAVENKQLEKSLVFFTGSDVVLTICKTLHTLAWG